MPTTGAFVWIVHVVCDTAEYQLINPVFDQVSSKARVALVPVHARKIRLLDAMVEKLTHASKVAPVLGLNPAPKLICCCPPEEISMLPFVTAAEAGKT